MKGGLIHRARNHHTRGLQFTATSKDSKELSASKSSRFNLATCNFWVSKTFLTGVEQLIVALEPRCKCRTIAGARVTTIDLTELGVSLVRHGCVFDFREPEPHRRNFHEAGEIRPDQGTYWRGKLQWCYRTEQSEFWTGSHPSKAFSEVAQNDAQESAIVAVLSLYDYKV